MALIACPECGRQVSAKAASCPQCAHPLSSPALGGTGQAPASVAVVPQAPLQIRPIGLLLGLILLGGAAFMFTTIDLSDKGRLLAGALAILGLVELVTGSTKRTNAR